MPILNDSNDQNKQITLYYHFLRRICVLPLSTVVQNPKYVVLTCNLSSSTKNTVVMNQ